MAERRAARLLLPIAFLLAAGTAYAQAPPEEQQFPRVALTIGWLPSSSATLGASSGIIGIVYERSERLAFRPELSFGTTFDRRSGDTLGPDTWSMGVAVTVQGYVARKDNLGIYVGPRFGYSRTSNMGYSTNSVYTAGLSLGLQYSLTRRISVYGEAGALYAFSKTSQTGSAMPYSSSQHSINSRSALGLCLYF